MKRVAWNKCTREDFIDRSVEVHGNKFSYDLVEYVNARTKVKILCNVCMTVFEQLPYSHLIGKGCRKCADEMLAVQRSADIAHFINRSKAIHGDKYTYEHVEYKNAKTPVLITCKEHGDFKVQPDNHWDGRGCPKCSNPRGFSNGREGTLYVLSHEDITKIGITNKAVRQRVYQINKDSGLNFKCVKTYYFKNGQQCSDLETAVLRYLRTVYNSPETKFDGSTECFIGADVPHLLDLIQSHIGG